MLYTTHMRIHAHMYGSICASRHEHQTDTSNQASVRSFFEFKVEGIVSKRENEGVPKQYPAVLLTQSSFQRRHTSTHQALRLDTHT